MRPAVIVLTTLSILLLSGSPSAAGGGRAEAEPMPEVLYSHTHFPEFARWVSAEAALVEDGTLREDLFHPESKRRIENFLSKPAEDGCIRIEEFFDSRATGGATGTLRGWMRHSELVLHGRVTARTYGFKASVPGQLVQIEPLHIYEGVGEVPTHYYVFFPVGTFSVGDKVICKTDRRFPDPPEIGDEVLLSVIERPDPSDPFLEPDLWGANGYITIHDGQVSLPLAFQQAGTPVSSRDDLLSLVREEVGNGP